MSRRCAAVHGRGGFSPGHTVCWGKTTGACDEVGLIEKHGLESFIMDINEKLPEKYRRRLAILLSCHRESFPFCCGKNTVFGLLRSLVFCELEDSTSITRTPIVKLCDEMMCLGRPEREREREPPETTCRSAMVRFAVGFAGIGGTSACCETVGAFLQRDLEISHLLALLAPCAPHVDRFLVF